jgi:hypothetical protein
MIDGVMTGYWKWFCKDGMIMRSGYAQERADLMNASPPLWQSRQLSLRSCQFGEIVPYVLASGNPDPRTSRIAMRGLYLQIRGPNPLERLQLRARRRRPMQSRGPAQLFARLSALTATR